MRAVFPKSMVTAAILIAALVAPAPGLAADPTPQASPLTVVGEKTSGDTTVVLVEQERKPVRETPAWAYPERGLTFFPDGPGEGKDRWAIGGIWQIAPMFTANYTRGLGSGFTLDARLKTIIMLNDLGIGAQWAFGWGPFSFGLMAHFDGFIGTMGKVLMTSEFNSLGYGLLFEPGAKAGLQVSKDTWLTAQFEAYLALAQATNLGGLTVSPDSRLWEGFGVSLIAEYAPRKQGVIYYGVSLYKTRTNYPVFFNVDYSPATILYLGLLAGYEF